MFSSPEQQDQVPSSTQNLTPRHETAQKRLLRFQTQHPLPINET